jgi:hypothetical protein
MPPAVPSALQADVGLPLIVLLIDAKQFTRRGIA